MMSFPRATGILLHPTSFPARGGIGDFGPAAYEFVDFLASARQGLWQVLPLGPPGYREFSLLFNLGICRQSAADQPGAPGRAWLDWIASQLAGLPRETGAVEYEEVFQRKLPLIVAAARNFLQNARGQRAASALNVSVRAIPWWLEDFVLFDALRERYDRTMLEGVAAGLWPAAKLRPWPQPARNWPPRWTSGA